MVVGVSSDIYTDAAGELLSTPIPSPPIVFTGLDMMIVARIGWDVWLDDFIWDISI